MKANENYLRCIMQMKNQINHYCLAIILMYSGIEFTQFTSKEYFKGDNERADMLFCKCMLISLEMS